MSTKRFRVAFSFSGERRSFVAEVAAVLAKRFGEDAILYDKYHEAEFARRDLGLVLPDLYHKETDLVVAILSSGYENKEWCGLEWIAIHARLKNRQDDAVMLARFDYAQVQGLYDTAGFIELDNKTPLEAANLILQRLAINEGHPKDFYVKAIIDDTIADPGAIPNNLPRIQAFFGRDKELAQIAAALEPTARGWGVLIDGPGGIGKTSLAIRSAELIPADRFRRIVFLSAKKRELTADGQRALGAFALSGYTEMLNAVARELDHSELLKGTEEDRTHVLLRALRAENVLLLLDNLESLPSEDRDRIFAFLNNLPITCSAIVTSRRRADASAIAVRLDRLEWPATQELIKELSQGCSTLERMTDVERNVLYEETGGNPLLIRWLVGQVRLGRRHTIDAALDFLRNAPPGNDPLEYVFGDLLETFSENETKVLAALAHFENPIGTRFIAELAGINEAAAEGALGDLSIRALILPDAEDRRFTLVAMVAEFLRRKRPEVIKATGSRLEERAYALIVENGYENHNRYPSLDAAWPAVAPALPRFLRGTSIRLQTVCDALQSFLFYTGRWDERLTMAEQAETKAVEAGDFYSAGWRAYDATWVKFLRGQADAVLAGAERASMHWITAKAGARERAIASRMRGIGHAMNKEYPKALTALRETLQIFQSISDESDDVARLLNDIATIERDMGDISASERGYKEALRIARSLNFAEGVTTYTGNLAELQLDRGNWIEAEVLARQALSIAEEIGNIDLIATHCYWIAIALTHQDGGSQEAKQFAKRAADIFSQLGSPQAEGALSLCRAT